MTLTQEFLAQMLGVQRASVSLVAAELQKAGLIRYRRGNIRIMDVEGLAAQACECYSAVGAQRSRIFGAEVQRSRIFGAETHGQQL